MVRYVERGIEILEGAARLPTFYLTITRNYSVSVINILAGYH